MTEIYDVAKETVYILHYFDPNFVSKIPNNVLSGLRDLAKKSSNAINTRIDKNKKLNEQNILEETKDLLSLLYYSYIANEEEKQEILKIWNENEILHQKEINEKYSIDSIFKKKNSDVDNSVSKEPTQISKFKVQDSSNNMAISVVKKEGLFKKISKFILNIFKRK